MYASLPCAENFQFAGAPVARVQEQESTCACFSGTERAAWAGEAHLKRKRSLHVHLFLLGLGSENRVRHIRYAHTCREFQVCGRSDGASSGIRFNTCIYFRQGSGRLGRAKRIREEAFTTCASFFARAWGRKPGEAHSLRTYVQRISGFAGQREGQSLA